MKVFIDTYGCSANANNAEIMAGLLQNAGFLVVSDESIADLVVLNTCVVKGPTLNKMIGRIKSISKPLIVAGCMPEVMPLEVSCVGPQHTKEIVKVAGATLKGKVVQATGKKNEVKLCLPRIRKNSMIDIVQIAEGCVGECSYCIVRKAKGKLNSYPTERILKEIEGSVKTGCKEIWITSQDNGCYGLDIDTDIVALLKKVSNVKGKFKVRLGMINPNHVLAYLDKLIEVFKDDKMFKFLHIPLQSGSDKVLKDMNRYYSVSDFLAIVEKFRAEIPEITIAFDIIVGYPTETKEDFEQSLSVIKETKPDVLNISRYWQMPDTPAAKLPQLKVNEIMKRSKEMAKLHEQIAAAKNKEWVGKEVNVIVDEGKKGNWIARNDSYKQVVINSQEELHGKQLKVRISGSGSCDLKAEIEPKSL